MRKGLGVFGASISLAALAVFAGSDRAQGRSWVIVLDEGSSASAVTRAISDAGASEIREVAPIGVLLARADRADFAAMVAHIPGVQGVSADTRSVRSAGVSAKFGVARVGPRAAKATSPKVRTGTHASDETWGHAQWALTAIHAEDAWHAGALGAGVRVVVIDTGIDPTHPDLAPNANMTLSKSFVPGESVQVPQGTWFPGAHGTHVAGIIAAADNGYGVIGVAPKAEIVAIKSMSSVDGYGSWGGMIESLVYAGAIEADVVNMSFGGFLDRRGGWDDNGTSDTSDDVWLSANAVSALLNAATRAVDYAMSRGATCIASAGNEAVDGDHTKDTIRIPQGLPGVICVSATGPLGWYSNPTTNLDLLAIYSNYGQSEIDLAAPGGNVDETFPAFWWWDMVMSDVPYDPNYAPDEQFAWAAGTSMAAPHVAGVAALVIGQHGGSMKPSQVETILRQTADDLGKRGRDDAYGHGRINAHKASTSK